ncbi:hypothetical protein TNCV_3854781 [Trichonephila clavipes]|nr:hypothetical protein TNCV_3854781 [Trichonephila clavipes]
MLDLCQWRQFHDRQFQKGIVIGMRKASWTKCQTLAETHLGVRKMHSLRAIDFFIDKRVTLQATSSTILHYLQDAFDISISTKRIACPVVSTGTS